MANRESRFRTTDVLLAVFGVLVLALCVLALKVSPGKVSNAAAAAGTTSPTTAESDAAETGYPIPQLAEGPIDMLVVGDSIAAGYDVVDEAASWPQVLRDRLSTEGRDVTLHLSARPGDTVAAGSTIPRDKKNDLVMLELGTNDAGQGVPAEQYRADIGKLMSSVASENPGAPIVLLGPWSTPTLASALDEAAIDVCSSTSECTDFVSLLDAYAAAGPIPAGQKVARGVSDGFHPGEEGHAEIVDAILASLRQRAVSAS